MKILGYTDSYTTCDCCGRTNLKGTYCVDDLHGNIYHFGSTCVKNKNWYDKTKGFKTQIDNNYRAKERELYNIYLSSGGEEIENKIKYLQSKHADIECFFEWMDKRDALKKRIIDEMNLKGIFKTF